MADIVENFKKVTVNTTYDASATSIVLSAGQGAELPDPSADGAYNLVWWNSTDYGDPADDPNVEIVRCTAISTDTLTVTRPAAGNNYLDEGSDNTASTKNEAGKTYKMQLAATKKVFDDLRAITLVKNETPGGTINGSNTAFTTAALFATGTLRVYLNGVRQRSGAGNDYTEDADLNGFTMTTAPATGDILLIDYETSGAVLAYGAASLIYNETPSGTVNGSNTAFDTANNYVAGTIQVFRDGQLMKGGGEDYTETDANTITFTTAPVTGSVLLVSYQTDISTAGNADLLDGAHASATSSASAIPIMDASGLMPDSTVDETALKITSMARVSSDGDLSISSGVTATVEFDVETYDIGSDFNTTTYEYTVPADGYVEVFANLRFAVTADADRLNAYITKNDSTDVTQVTTIAAGTSDETVVVHDIRAYSSGDRIEIRVQNQDNNDTIRANGIQTFAVFKYLGNS